MLLYLVSGANGFVGRALCRLLTERGCRVRALLHHDAAGPWHERCVCDLGSGSLPTGVCRGVDGIFHLAGLAHLPDQCSTEESLYRRVNVDGTRLLLDAAKAAGVGRFIYFSSVKAAAEPGDDCVDETWDAPPADAYGQSKRAAEQVVLAAAREGLHASVLRPTLVYGPGVKGNLRRMLDAVACGRFPPLPESHNRRSMVSVADLADAAWLAMTTDAANARVYIVADGVDYSTRALYLAICQAFGRRPPSWSLPMWLLTAGARAGDLLGQALGRPMPYSSLALTRLCGSACYRADRLRAELSWRPRQDFFTVVDEMLSAQNARRSAPPA
ncbi:MAG: NAD-dependent epimerase/dehydratase family protein [Chromatiaceae bacterium]|nr:MAG: NAD-dependent epimerase/dehydratase family protein [Chromatiaceae bacterium]